VVYVLVVENVKVVTGYADELVGQWSTLQCTIQYLRLSRLRIRLQAAISTSPGAPVGQKRGRDDVKL
jgi:hypothetical protein